MFKYTNTTNIPLSLAVFLATDTYDHCDDPYTISVTTLIKPIRQIVLAARVPQTEAVIELSDMMPNRMGSAIHDAIERAWCGNYSNAMSALGYPKKVVERVVINPHPEQLEANKDWIIPIYLEQRAHQKVGRWTISGKFDFVGDGRLEDFKSTSTYSWIHGSNDVRHVLQGSIYRWLNPELVTKDEMAIQYIFTDWSRTKSLSDPKYPPNRHQQKLFLLKSIQETEKFIKSKLAQIEQYWDVPEEQIPLCDDEDLWRSDPVWKYYKNPQKTARSTKNFDSKQDAYVRLSEDGNVGIVIERPGQVTACKYCAAFSMCSQKDVLVAQGDLVL